MVAPMVAPVVARLQWFSVFSRVFRCFFSVFRDIRDLFSDPRDGTGLGLGTGRPALR